MKGFYDPVKTSSHIHICSNKDAGKCCWLAVTKAVFRAASAQSRVADNNTMSADFRTSSYQGPTWRPSGVPAHLEIAVML